MTRTASMPRRTSPTESILVGTLTCFLFMLLHPTYVEASACSSIPNFMCGAIPGCESKGGSCQETPPPAVSGPVPCSQLSMVNCFLSANCTPTLGTCVNKPTVPPGATGCITKTNALMCQIDALICAWDSAKNVCTEQTFGAPTHAPNATGCASNANSLTCVFNPYCTWTGSACAPAPTEGPGCPGRNALSCTFDSKCVYSNGQCVLKPTQTPFTCTSMMDQMSCYFSFSCRWDNDLKKCLDLGPKTPKPKSTHIIPTLPHTPRPTPRATVKPTQFECKYIADKTQCSETVTCWYNATSKACQAQPRVTPAPPFQCSAIKDALTCTLLNNFNCTWMYDTKTCNDTTAWTPAPAETPAASLPAPLINLTGCAAILDALTCISTTGCQYNLSTYTCVNATPTLPPTAPPTLTPIAAPTITPSPSPWATVLAVRTYAPPSPSPFSTAAPSSSPSAQVPCVALTHSQCEGTASCTYDTVRGMCRDSCTGIPNESLCRAEPWCYVAPLNSTNIGTSSSGSGSGIRGYSGMECRNNCTQITSLWFCVAQSYCTVDVDTSYCLFV